MGCKDIRALQLATYFIPEPDQEPSPLVALHLGLLLLTDATVAARTSFRHSLRAADMTLPTTEDPPL